jgi:hypothetical protein
VESGKRKEEAESGSGKRKAEAEAGSGSGKRKREAESGSVSEKLSDFRFFAFRFPISDFRFPLSAFRFCFCLRFLLLLSAYAEVESGKRKA